MASLKLYGTVALMVLFVLTSCKDSSTKRKFHHYKQLGDNDSIPALDATAFDSLTRIPSAPLLVLTTHYHTKSAASISKLRELKVDFELFSLDYPSTNPELLREYYAQNKELVGLFSQLPTRAEYKEIHAEWDFQPNWAIVRKADSARWIWLEKVDWTTDWWK